MTDRERPVLPAWLDELKPMNIALGSDTRDAAYADGWNECRAEVLSLVAACPPPQEEPTDAEVSAAIGALAERAKRGVFGISGHAWNAKADIERQAELLKRALLASPPPSEAPGVKRYPCGASASGGLMPLPAVCPFHGAECDTPGVGVREDENG
jgi:hypothetical protein